MFRFKEKRIFCFRNFLNYFKIKKKLFDIMQATFKVYIKMYWNQTGKLEIFDTTAAMSELMEDDDEENESDEEASDEENEEPKTPSKDLNNNKVVSKKKEQGNLIEWKFYVILDIFFIFILFFKKPK